MPNKRLDPPIIAKAPDEVASGLGVTATDKDFDDELIGRLMFELEAAKAQIDELSGQSTVEQVRAELMGPYASKVFNFVVAYCGVVALFLILSAFKYHTGFILSGTILAIIAGSTAVAVIGLIGMVVSGLFGSTK